MRRNGRTPSPAAGRRRLASRQYVEERKSCAQIGREIGCSDNCVRQALSEADIARRPAHLHVPDQAIALLSDPTWLRDADRYANALELAEELGCSTTPVHAALKRFNIDPYRTLERKHRASGQRLRAGRARTERQERARQRLTLHVAVEDTATTHELHRARKRGLKNQPQTARIQGERGMDARMEDVREWSRHYTFDSFKVIPSGTGWVDLAAIAE